jgi:hypothetical protein
MKKLLILLLFFSVIMNIPQVSGQSTLYIVTVDRNGALLAGSTVQLSWDGNQVTEITNSSGIATFSGMSVRTYNVGVFWYGVEVLNTLFYYNGTSIPIVFACEVYRLTVNVVDKWGDPVPNAEVTVSWSPSYSVFKPTNNSGTVLFNQLPHGNFQIEAVFNDFRNSTEIILDSNKIVSLVLDFSVNVYTLTVEVRDEQDKLAEGAVVQLFKGEELLYTGVTANGIVSFVELERGTYRVIVDWKGAIKEENVEIIDRDVFVKISFKVDYASWFFYTFIVAALALLVCVLLYYYIGKRKRRAIHRISPKKSVSNKPTVTKISIGNPGVAHTKLS